MDSLYLLNSSSRAKISLKSGVSQFNSNNNDTLLVKHNNRLFKISATSDLESKSRIFQILTRPKKLSEILYLLPEFKKKDVVDILCSLDKLDLLKVDSDGRKHRSGNKITSINSDSFLAYHAEKDSNKSVRSNSRLVLIGDGILADKLALSLINAGIRFSRSSSSVIIDKDPERTSHNTKKKNRRGRESMYSYSSNLSPVINKTDLIVVAEDYPNLVLFEKINELCFKKNKAWLRASFDDIIGYVGPLVVPGKTSCYNCCELRLVTNSPHYEYELWINRRNIPKKKLLVPEYFAEILSTICMHKILRFLSHSKNPKKLDELIVLDTQQVNTTRHNVITHPNCIFCNPPPRRRMRFKSFTEPIAMSLKRRPLRFLKSRKSTSLPDEELLGRLRQIVDAKTGIVLEYSKLYESHPLGIYSHHFSTAPCSKPLRIGLNGQLTKPVRVEDSLISPSPSGSGFSPREAEIHTLMESVERYSNMVVDESRIVWSSFDNIRKAAIDPRSLVLYSDEQSYQNDRCSRFSASSTIPWIEGYDLYSAKPIMVPADFVFYPPIRERPLVFDTSNGASAHTDIKKSILNGLFEVIERDSFLSMWLNRFSMPILNLKELPVGFAESIKKMKGHGMCVKLVNLTIDTNIPTVAAICYNKNPNKYPALLVGAGSHIEPEKAVQKALFEMEFMLSEILANPEKEKITRAEEISSMYKHPLFYLNPKMRKYWEFVIASTKTSDLPKYVDRTKADHDTLTQIVQNLHNMNRKVVYVDMTSSELSRMGLTAVKVFVTDFQPLYVGTRRRVNLRRLEEAARYVKKNIKAARFSSELNSAPHPLP
jgi:ribosomal protein S12 methylthiotransferase accessory factor